jgi:hypothetical protein
MHVNVWLRTTYLLVIVGARPRHEGNPAPAARGVLRLRDRRTARSPLSTYCAGVFSTISGGAARHPRWIMAGGIGVAVVCLSIQPLISPEGGGRFELALLLIGLSLGSFGIAAVAWSRPRPAVFAVSSRPPAFRTLPPSSPSLTRWLSGATSWACSWGPTAWSAEGRSWPPPSPSTRPTPNAAQRSAPTRNTTG